MELDDEFEDLRPETATNEDLVLDLEGYEGPLDVLLTLARQQKVDLTRISILTLAEQYLAFITTARQLHLELAADYLVMAAWLAYLKSRLLLPEPETEGEESSGPELAEALTYQLRRLEAMRQRGEKLMARPRLGREVFPRGAPEGVKIIRKPVYELSLFELLRAYGEQRRRSEGSVLTFEPSELYAMEQALERLRGFIGEMTDWRTLLSYVPPDTTDGLVMRSAVAATFTAGLELARSGDVQLRQASAFGPIYVRRNRPE